TLAGSSERDLGRTGIKIAYRAELTVRAHGVWIGGGDASEERLRSWVSLVYRFLDRSSWPDCRLIGGTPGAQWRERCLRRQRRYPLGAERDVYVLRRRHPRVFG